jgi:hypothetical protein
MIQLKVPTNSIMDDNLEDAYNHTDSWESYIKSLPYVKDAVWEWDEDSLSHTRITFESEEHKTWFILRWS